MNRRQRKKEYRKKHGYNPPKTDPRYNSKYIGRLFTKWLPEIHHEVEDTVRGWCRDMLDMIKSVDEYIHNMSENEWNLFLENKDIGEATKELAKKIREK